jgi:hypothetical protein
MGRPGGTAGRGGGWRAAGRHHGLLARLAAPFPVPGALPRSCRAVRAHAQAPRLPAQRSASRGADHVAARGSGRRQELGLPLHLDPRFGVHPVRADAARLHRGGGRLHDVAGGTLSRSTRRPGTAGTVRDRREPADTGNHAGPPRRLQGLPARPRGQLGRRAAATGHLRRADGLGVPVQQVRPDDRLRPVGGAGPAARLAGEALAASRRRDLGKPRRPAPEHLLGPDDVGGVRAGDTGRPPAAGCPPPSPAGATSPTPLT